MARRGWREGLLAALTLTVAACGPQGISPASNGGEGRGEASRTRKVLSWGVQHEPSDFVALSGLGGSTAPSSDFGRIAHSALGVATHARDYQPRLAVELPSVERGTWQLNADGTMETTWRIHQDARWHDGTPLTSTDFVFTLNVLKSLAGSRVRGLRQMSAFATPDANTFVIHWSQPFVGADQTPETPPLPRHILEDAFQPNDPQAFFTHGYFTTGFVGLGPYRLVRWEPGSHMELERFDQYFRGRPTIDRVIMRFMGDPNTMLSNALAGAVDYVVPTDADVNAVLEIRRRWDGTGNRVVINTRTQMRLVQFQGRPELARPHGAVSVGRVRQALTHAIDREAMTQAVTGQLAPVADSWFAPADPMRREVESAIPRFPYDPARAQQLLAQAGWVRGADGMLANQASGERFETELWGRPGSSKEQDLEIIGDYWKAIGAASKPYLIPLARVDDLEHLASYPIGIVTNPPADSIYSADRFHSRNIAGPATRWSGRNSAGYSSVAADEIQDRLSVTIDPSERVVLHRRLLQEMMNDVAIIPLYWEINIALVADNLQGLVTAEASGWNIAEWDKV